MLREVDGVRTTVSHDNKWTKGRLARALRDAVALDPRETGVPSTKGML